LHPFMKGRPDLETTIESLGNWVREKVLLNQVLHAASQGYWQTKCNLLDQTTNNKQETKGIGSRKKRQKKKKIKLKVNQVIHYQPERGWIHKIPTPHWDFIGWRKVAAKTCHGSYTSHYVEGMMLHVWPTTRDSYSQQYHWRAFEDRNPEYIHVSFGDALASGRCGPWRVFRLQR
jgi:hypothetical protein